MSAIIRHGWYSQKMRDLISHERGKGAAHEYKTPDGKAVIVTTVTNEKNRESILWDDLYCVGEVTEWIREV
jgi:Ribonuclease G/E